MSTCLLVVAAPGTPAAGEVALRSRLLSEHGFTTVEYYDDSSAEKADAATYDLIVLGASCVSGTLGTKYASVAAPMLILEAFVWDDHSFCTNTIANASEVDGTVTDAALAGLALGTYTLSSSGTASTRLYGGTKVSFAAAVEHFLDRTGDTAYSIGWRCEAGASLLSGTAAARRVGLGFHENAYDNLTADGNAILDAQVNWLLDIPPIRLWDGAAWVDALGEKVWGGSTWVA